MISSPNEIPFCFVFTHGGIHRTIVSIKFININHRKSQIIEETRQEWIFLRQITQEQQQQQQKKSFSSFFSDSFANPLQGYYWPGMYARWGILRQRVKKNLVQLSFSRFRPSFWVFSNSPMLPSPRWHLSTGQLHLHSHSQLCPDLFFLSYNESALHCVCDAKMPGSWLSR